ncbi:hypothetical protein B7494_g7421 [Chlorociboria aeruginascens]|nr:hypothetical protein B7494_g7421 [Chlorociboria aeruginascens]
MPANQRQQTTQSPSSPSSKATAKYTNKDGSKFITVPKNFDSSESSKTSPAMAQTTTKPNGQTPLSSTITNGTAPAVNRKKQKRREKARLKAEQPPNSQANGVHTVNSQMPNLEARFREHRLNNHYGQERHDFDPGEDEGSDSEDDGDAYSGSYGRNESPANGYGVPTASSSGKKSKKKKKTKGSQPEFSHTNSSSNGISQNDVSLQPPPLESTTVQRGPGISKEKIWNTSSQEERERIKEFWLSLGEDDRKSLVKVEKDAVLKKMKEQQKHSCSCTVCGRKRTAIEEELEVLYDAYYEELEQYANHQGDGRPPPMMPPPRRFGAIGGLQPPNRLPFNGQQPSRGRIVEQLGEDEDEGEEEYSEDDADEEGYSSEEPQELPRSHATDFFNFGNSLTVQGGILTVADDLLKNDGKKFIEMMEQLAERRMAREEDAKEQFGNYGHPPNGSMHPHSHSHSQPPPPDDEEYDDDEEEEEEYDSLDDEYDEEEMDTMTEEQRMEEGRRMFQIFAARMFEQRVLTAYKEKVAKERQQKLLEELEEESRADTQKKAKKAKDAQKKKDKAQQKKQALAEEKAKQAAAQAAQEAADRAAEEKKADDQRLRVEERRKKKEASKKAEEEERARKEAEKQKRLQDQRDRQIEQERKLREAKERERREKEELRKREREAKEAKDREAKERKEKQEKEKRDKEAQAKAEKEAKDQLKREELAAQQSAAQAAHTAIQASRRPPQPHPIPIPTNFQSHPSSVASPHVQVATPAIPKAPTPIRLRTTSQQEANGSVPQTPLTGVKSQAVSPNPTTPSQGSPGPIGPPGKTSGQPPFLHQPQATSPVHSALKGPPGIGQSGPFSGMPMGMAFQPVLPMMAPGFGGRMHHEVMFPHQPMGSQFRPGMPIHPGLHAIPQGRGFQAQHGPPGFPQQAPNGLGGIGPPYNIQKDGVPSQSHSRHQSASFEKPFDVATSAPQTQPIARPAPIGRPSSVVHGQRHGNYKSDVDDLSNHLGSSALLDDSDEPLSGPGARRSSGAPNLARQNFAPAPFAMEPSAFGSPITSYNSWGGQNPFGTSSLPGSNYIGSGWGPTPNGSFGAVGGVQTIRPSQPRSVAVRLMICRACRNLEGSTPDGFYDINVIKEQLDLFNPGEQPVAEQEVLDICETEGNAINGGGTFAIIKDSNGHYSIRYEADAPSNQRHGAPGEIGSPVVGSSGRFPPGLGGPNPF